MKSTFAGFAALAAPQITESVTVNHNGFGANCDIVLFGRAGNKTTLKFDHERINFGVRDIGLRDHA